MTRHHRPRCLIAAAIVAWASVAHAQASAARGDGREPFRASGYLGFAFDNFAPSEVGNYENPGEGGASRQRFIGGVNFEFRGGDPERQVQFWLAGETLHGVRSADVDCRNREQRPPVCETLSANPSESFLYILEHASTMEAYIAPRLELFTLQKETSFPSKFYIGARFGVMMMNDSPQAFDAFHVGAGLLALSRAFDGSYLEVGWGKTDAFVAPPRQTKWRRLKIDGLLSFPIAKAFTDRAEVLEKAPRVFIQLYSDFDPFGAAADSMQTFIGLEFDLDALFRF
jgi:hypothetical protein